MYANPMAEEPGFHPNLTCVHGDRRRGNSIPGGVREPNPRRDAETQSPGDAETLSPGMLLKPGDMPYQYPRPIRFKGLITRDTLHGSRANLRQRDPNGRIVPAPSDVSDKGASTESCARRKKNDIYTDDVRDVSCLSPNTCSKRLWR